MEIVIKSLGNGFHVQITLLGIFTRTSQRNTLIELIRELIDILLIVKLCNFTQLTFDTLGKMTVSRERRESKLLYQMCICLNVFLSTNVF